MRAVAAEERERRCILTGEVKDPSLMVRFVVAPDGRLLPDLGGELPGRGLWLTASRAALEKAIRKGAFARAARAPVAIADGLADQIERLLERRCLDLLGLARRAGQVAVGFEKVKALIEAGKARVLIAARDGAADGRAKLARLAGPLPVVALFGAAELGLALGRENVVHAALGSGRLGERFLAETTRLSGFRPAAAGKAA
jgi:hypothetical protein